MIHLDANFVVAVLRGHRAATAQMEAWIAYNELVAMSAVAWSELLCGPLTSDERERAELLVYRVEAFDSEDATLAASLFNHTGRRSRSLSDCMIAAVAIRRECALATFDRAGFARFRRFHLRLADV